MKSKPFPTLRTVSLSAIVLAVASVCAQEPDVKLNVTGQLIGGPSSASQFPEWLKAMKLWRGEELAKVHYNGSIYSRPELQWAHSSFIQPLTMVEDRFFYDPQTRKYTVRKYLADLNKRYGGVDSILIWPTYPNIGIDDRNTDQMFRSMPGGILGVKQMVRDFKKEGVRVMFPIHPWDVGTQDPGKPWSTILPSTMAEIQVDGMNGDTMTAVTQDFFDNSVADNNPLVIEPELGLDGQDGLLGWDVLSWGYWDTGGTVPLVSRNKWLERRHLVHVCDRWSQDKLDLIQYAFFNGVGIETWENIWSIWNQMTDRDSEAVRRVATIDRAFPKLLISSDWEPHTPTKHFGAVFASKWPSEDGSQTLWTIVNRSGEPQNGEQLEVQNRPGFKYYDLWNGVELHPTVSGDKASLSFPIEAHGYGAVLATSPSSVPVGLRRLLSTMRQFSQNPLEGFSVATTVLPQKMTDIRTTKAAISVPAGMVALPATDFDFTVQGIEIEGDDRPGLDVQYPWETLPHRSHRHTVHIPSIYIDKYPATNIDFKRFMDATKYKPADSQNFLLDWKNGTYPEGWANKPVTWVSIEDARAYAKWAGKRLPHEWEWQYAAQGNDHRLYPWGNEWDAAQVPPQTKSRSQEPPFAVDASKGASPFGVKDLVGNVWQWTDEFTDEHTRTAILRGGSRYNPQGSMWYFPQAYRLNQHGKYLLMAPGRDRSANIGFRCVVDAR